MANLIITIISIALIAIAALMGAYYGGAAFNSASPKAYAATIINGMRQVEAAYRLSLLDNRPFPSFDLNELITWNYLKEIPVTPPFKDAANVTVANPVWMFDLSGQVYAMVAMGDDCGTPTCTTPNILTCIEINRQLGINNASVATVDYQGLPDLVNVIAPMKTACYGDSSFGMPTFWYEIK